MTGWDRLLPHQRKALAELAERVVAGEVAPAVQMGPINADHTARLVAGLGDLYGRHPVMRTVAHLAFDAVARRHGRRKLAGVLDVWAAEHGTGPGHSERAMLWAIWEWVRTTLDYVEEPGEQVATIDTTLRRGWGDCDDHALVVGALCQALNLPWRVSLLERRSGGPWRPFHVFIEARVGDEWLPLETTRRDVQLWESPGDYIRRTGGNL